ncbi:MAG: hypothetical protein V4586_14830 [Pseudomonadota bacterium]
MVAYSFRPRFETAIREGWKTQTIRKGHKRHASKGHMLQLFTGMPTVHCKKICPDVCCTGVSIILISFDNRREINRIMIGGIDVHDFDVFAVRDGFIDIGDMSEFWRREHGPLAGLEFNGMLIKWAAPLFEAIA